MHRGFAKLYRKFLDWEWYDDINCKIIYIHCLLRANHINKKYRGENVSRGTFLTSYADLARETGLSVKQVRTALSKLAPQYVTSERARKGQVISIVKFETYNGAELTEGTQEGRVRAGQGQEGGKKRATTKKDKKDKKDKKYVPARASHAIDWLDDQIWAEWIDFKRRRKTQVTERAINRNIAKLEQLGKEYANDILQQSMDRGWTDLYELKNSKPCRPNNDDVRAEAEASWARLLVFINGRCGYDDLAVTAFEKSVIDKTKRLGQIKREDEKFLPVAERNYIAAYVDASQGGNDVS
jgi:hypothetical protein